MNLISVMLKPYTGICKHLPVDRTICRYIVTPTLAVFTVPFGAVEILPPAEAGPGNNSTSLDSRLRGNDNYLYNQHATLRVPESLKFSG